MRVQNPKSYHYTVETTRKEKGQGGGVMIRDFQAAATELTYTQAERVAEKLAKEDDNLMIRIMEKRLLWRNY